MSQIQVRDTDGTPLARINIRISEGTKPSEDAIYDIFTDLAGNSGWPIPFWPPDEFTLWTNDANVDPAYGTAETRVPAGHHGNIAITLAKTAEPGPEPGPTPSGIVRTSGQMLLDDGGPKSFLTTTFFSSLRLYKNEPDRWLANIRWCQSRRFDGIRTLACVTEWGDELNIDPIWHDYETVLMRQIDDAFAHGLRQFPLTIFGGDAPSHPVDLDDLFDSIIRVCTGREEKIGYFEIVNERAQGDPDKMSRDRMNSLAARLRQAFPQNLIALSTPDRNRPDAWDEMEADLAALGGPVIFPVHTERNENDKNWRQVRQSYDFVTVSTTSSDQEGPGPASSVGQLWKPRQMGMKRWLASATGCGVYCLHTGSGVFSIDLPAQNRQANLYDIPGIDEMCAALRMVEPALPDGIQNWKVVNNGRDSEHPLQLPDDVGDGFWEGNDAVEQGSVNKNYAALGPNGTFMVGIFGQNSDNRAGQALYDMRLTCVDSLTGAVAFDGTIQKDAWLSLPGRPDREMSYLIFGQRL